MDPLFKWPGGKSGELEQIRTLAPSDWQRYVEPFAGGAAVFFDLEPQSAVLNDINPNLVEAYRMIARDHSSLEKEMRSIAAARKSVALLAEKTGADILQQYRSMKKREDREQIVQNLDWRPFRVSSWANRKNLQADICKSLRDKLGRTWNHEKRKGAWQDEDVLRQIETAFHAGLYFYIRDDHLLSSRASRVGQFLYLREFAYGGMFRFNQKGKFNIPYGGYSYNKKSLSSKIDTWIAPSTRKLLRGAKLECGSFEELDQKYTWQEDDFFFLDPPYDTEFSDYDQFAFGGSEQATLANWFAHLPSRALMIIGKTPAIEKLYEDASKINKQIVIEEYEKTYTYNVRGRNNRQQTHLAIRNY